MGTPEILFTISNTLYASIRWRQGGSIQRLAAGLPTGVGGEIEIIGRIMPLATEARVGELTRRNGLRGLAPRAAPIPGGGGGRICRGSWGACPLTYAVEVKNGVAGGAGPHRSRSPNHIITDHTLHSPTGELVLDFVDQLRNGCVIRRRSSGRAGLRLIGMM